jgi:hypothetical protein
LKSGTVTWAAIASSEFRTSNPVEYITNRMTTATTFPVYARTLGRIHGLPLSPLLFSPSIPSVTIQAKRYTWSTPSNWTRKRVRSIKRQLQPGRSESARRRRMRRISQA